MDTQIHHAQPNDDYYNITTTNVTFPQRQSINQEVQTYQVNQEIKSQIDCCVNESIKLDFGCLDDEPAWKTSIRSKEKSFGGRTVQSKIKQKFAKMAKANSKITQFMKNIATQLKTTVLTTYKPSTTKTTPHQFQTIVTQPPKQTDITQKKQQQILADKQVIKDSCLRNMLVQSHVDNDVPSDDEDLNAGIRYMYSELLYSVGSEMVNQRTAKNKQLSSKKMKSNFKNEANKQNQDHNQSQLKTKGSNVQQNFNNVVTKLNFGNKYDKTCPISLRL